MEDPIAEGAFLWLTSCMMIVVGKSVEQEAGQIEIRTIIGRPRRSHRIYSLERLVLRNVIVKSLRAVPYEIRWLFHSANGARV